MDLSIIYHSLIILTQCSSGEVGVPDNFAGYSKAKTGKGYMGAILSGSNRNFREYFQGTLSSPMIEGQKYCVSFWYKLASGSKFAVDQLGLHFSETEVANGNKSHLNFKAHLSNKEGLFLDNTEEWVQFCHGIYCPRFRGILYRRKL